MSLLSTFRVYYKVYKEIKKRTLSKKYDPYCYTYESFKTLVYNLWKLDLQKGVTFEQRARVFQTIKAYNRYFKGNMRIDSWKTGSSDYARYNSLVVPDKISNIPLTFQETTPEKQEAKKPQIIQLQLF